MKIEELKEEILRLPEAQRERLIKDSTTNHDWHRLPLAGMNLTINQGIVYTAHILNMSAFARTKKRSATCVSLVTEASRSIPALGWLDFKEKSRLMTT